jgi:hypothetical protein
VVQVEGVDIVVQAEQELQIRGILVVQQTQTLLMLPRAAAVPEDLAVHLQLLAVLAWLTQLQVHQLLTAKVAGVMVALVMGQFHQRLQLIAVLVAMVAGTLTVAQVAVAL